MSTRPGPLLRLSVLAVLSIGLLFAPGAAQATPVSRPVAWGCTNILPNAGWCNVPGGLSGATAIAAGREHGLALKNDGTVVAWGCGNQSADFGQCSVPGGLSGVTAIAASDYDSLALKNDGTVVAWGCGPINNVGQCTVPGGLSGVTAIAAGFDHSLALKGDGTVVAWGCGFSSDHGQCSVPGGLSGVVAISASTYSSLALKSDGSVVAWGCGPGSFDSGQCTVPGGLSGVTAIAAGEAHSLALKGDGSVVAWGCRPADFGQCSVPSAVCHATAIAASFVQSLALAELCQTITFGALVERTYGDRDFSVSARASSGLAVSFAASGPCTVSGAAVHLTSAGSCTVTASQAGDANYNPAPDVSQTFAIAKASQTIAFGGLANKTYGAPDFRVSAIASSGLPVSFAGSGHCTVRGATVHLTGAGSCTVIASQTGDARYNAAPRVSRSFLIGLPCKVPKVVGKRLASAKRTITTRHCRTGKVGHAYSRKHGRGIVLSQSRRPGRVLPAGSRIDLVVSRGRRR
jgi:hypothetical protein